MSDQALSSNVVPNALIVKSRILGRGARVPSDGFTRVMLHEDHLGQVFKLRQSTHNVFEEILCSYVENDALNSG